MIKEKEYCRETADVICLGQAVIDCVTRNRVVNPERPGSSTADSIILRAGGDAVNESIALAGMGRCVLPVFAVGEDAAGELLLRSLEEKGIDTSRVVRMGPSFETPVANIFVEEDGSRSSVSSKAVMLPGFREIGESMIPCPEGSVPVIRARYSFCIPCLISCPWISGSLAKTTRPDVFRSRRETGCRFRCQPCCR